MKTTLGIIGLFLLSTLLYSCVNIQRVITLNPDGSGTFQETLAPSLFVYKQFKGIDSAKFIDKAKRKAILLGKDIQFVSQKIITTKDSLKGISNIYSFSDINNLHFDFGLAMNVPINIDIADSNQEEISFEYTKKRHSELKIIVPKEREDSLMKEAFKTFSNPDRPQSFQAAKTRYAGINISLKIQINGKVKKTNASYIEKNKAGSLITLFDMDVGKIFADTNALIQANPENLTELKAAFPQYLIDEPNEIVKIRFTKQ